MKYPITIVLLGDIAAGKGTQAEILVKKFKLHLIDTGAYSRRVLTGRSKVSQRLTRVKLGKLAPSDIIQNYLASSLSRLRSGEGVLLDGGKMPAEARLVHRIFKRQGRNFLVIYLRIPKTEIFRRLAFRYYCARTGQPLAIKGPVKKCPHCGGPVIKRADDDPKAIRNRIAYYDKIYSQTVKFWRSQKALRLVNGNQIVAKVTRDIIQTIRNFGWR